MNDAVLSPSLLPTISFALLAFALAAEAVGLIRTRGSADAVSPYLLGAAAVLLLADIVRRSLIIRFVAVTGLFESLVFFSAFVCVVVLVYRILARQKALGLVVFGGTIAAVLLLALASSPLAPKEILPPVPALRSHWLVLHVTFSFVGESFFVVALVTSVLFLAGRDRERRDRLDRLTYLATAIGYPVFSVGALVFGAIWADVAWGSYWSWDPKEIWALVTWLTYTVYLHTRLVPKWRGVVSSVVSIVGFVFTLFTLFGVNFLIAGLHSYR